jgi:hypothetical protein
MRWFAVYSAALAMAAGCIHVASAQGQPVPQGPAGNAVPVTVDNFNRAEIDMYLGTIVKDRGIGSLRHSRELALFDSPIPRPNRDTLYSFAVFDFDAGAGDHHAARCRQTLHVDVGDR